MARVRTDTLVAATPRQAWNLVTDWTAHGRWIPLTTVTIDVDSPVAAGVGTRFTGRTGLGRIGFDDPMVVTEWQPPDDSGNGHCRVVKQGPWLTGWAEVRVARTEAGTQVSWLEDVRSRGVPRWADRLVDPLVSAVGTALFSRVLRKLAAELASSRPE